ncbi:hypothetical protein Leryth_004996 [Lithospermum erythrorhizon]|nr:hypothetical protein Leryth_004996 [Lithospermum erythrorhizon]
MGSKNNNVISDNTSTRSITLDRNTSSISGLRARHQHELDNLSLTTKPFTTIKLFILAVVQYFRQSLAYLVAHRGWLVFLCILLVAAGGVLVSVNGPHGKHMDEVHQYLKFVLWWVALGVASSIGLGSGLHTFVLYLGPHIAFFTIKAVQCGRIDIKSAPYDTIQLKSTPSWLDKECSAFGPPVFTSSHGTRVPLMSILPQVQLEAILWGIGTALGELPPYFISRAASISGSPVNAMDELDTQDNGVISRTLTALKRWLLSHAQYLNFFSILVLASVPNPLFDLAGIMCGQFGVPFWEFFFATMLGKAIIKTHIQTIFIIIVCNNQLLHWIENELLWVLSFIPGVDAILPNLISKLHSMKDKYLATKPPPTPSNIEVKKWGFSLASIWNGVVWLMLLNFFAQIVTSTAQRYLKKQHDKELSALKNKGVSTQADDLDHTPR